MDVFSVYKDISRVFVTNYFLPAQCFALNMQNLCDRTGTLFVLYVRNTVLSDIYSNLSLVLHYSVCRAKYMQIFG